MAHVSVVLKGDIYRGLPLMARRLQALLSGLVVILQPPNLKTPKLSVEEFIDAPLQLPAAVQ